MALGSDGILRYYKIKEPPADLAKLPKPAGEISIRCAPWVVLKWGRAARVLDGATRSFKNIYIYIRPISYDCVDLLPGDECLLDWPSNTPAGCSFGISTPHRVYFMCGLRCFWFIFSQTFTPTYLTRYGRDVEDCRAWIDAFRRQVCLSAAMV
jgi:hypothetical protein